VPHRAGGEAAVAVGELAAVVLAQDLESVPVQGGGAAAILGSPSTTS